MKQKQLKPYSVRDMLSKVVGLLTKQGIKVEFRGNQPMVATRGDEIVKMVLPEVGDDISDQMMEAMHGFLDHECAHILYTQFKQGSEWQRKFGEGERSRRAMVANIVEDIRIERLMPRDLPGTKHNLERMYETFIPKYIDPATKRAIAQGTPSSCFAGVMVPAMRALSGQKAFKRYMDDEGLWPHFDPMITAYPDLEKDLVAMETYDEVLEISEKVLKAMQPPEDDQDGEGDDGQGDADTDESDDASEDDRDTDPNDGEGHGDGEGTDDGEDEERGDCSGDEDEANEDEDGPGADGDDGDEGEDADDEGDVEGSADEDADEDADDDAKGGASGEGEDADDTEEGDEEGEGGASQSGSSGDDEDADDAEEGEEGQSEPGSCDEDNGERSIGFDVSDSDLERHAKDMDGMFEDIIAGQMKGTVSDSGWRPWTRDFDTLVDLEVPNSTPISGIDSAVAKTVGPMMKDIRRLIAAQSQVRRIPGMRSGRLHGPNLHRLLAGDDRLFARREEAQSLDTAMTLLIDCSGSMGGGRYKTAVQAAYAIGQVLSKVGIAFECLGFKDNHHHPEKDRIMAEIRQQGLLPGQAVRVLPLEMPAFKTFDERWRPDIQRRFAYGHNGGGSEIAPGMRWGSTPEGDGNEFAARRLLQRPEQRKIMITLTDGSPGTPSLHDQRHRNPCLEFSKEMVRKIEAAGIDLVGIGIQHDGVQNYYSNNIVINDVSELPVKLMGVLKKLIVGK